MEMPPDIITEILLRLPAKTLGRFKTVSKSWLALISQPQFHKHHLNTSCKSTRLVYDSTSGSIYSLPLNQLDQTPTFNLLLTHLDSFEFHGSCNGLVFGSSRSCLVDDFRVPYPLVILNPTTKQHIQLPIAGNHMFRDWTPYKCGFGYDSLNDDYKVVTLTSCIDGNNCIYVYSLRSNSWRRLMDYPYDNDNSQVIGYSIVFLNGFLHWIVDPDKDIRVIVAFSLVQETFSEVPMPWPIIWDDGDCKLFVYGEKLGIFLGDKVLVMNEYGVKDSWSQIVIHGVEIDYMQYWKKTVDSDDNYASLNNTNTFYEDGKIILANDHGLILVYDVEGKSFTKTIDTSKDIEALLFVHGSYVESLVSPKFSLTNQKSASSSEGSRVGAEETEGTTTDDDTVEDNVTGLEESHVTVLSSLQSYKEALADNELKLSEIEAYLKSIEDEKLVLEGKLAELSDELSGEKDRALRISVDFDNFRKRTEYERISLVANAKAEVVKNLLPVLDNFERANAAIKVENEKEEKINNSYQNIYKQFVEILTSLGVVPVEKPLDPLA